jgi:hypothetical protein
MLVSRGRMDQTVFEDRDGRILRPRARRMRICPVSVQDAQLCARYWRQGYMNERRPGLPLSSVDSDEKGEVFKRYV